MSTMQNAYGWSDAFALGVNLSAVAFAVAGTLGALLPAEMLASEVRGVTLSDSLRGLCVFAFAAMSAFSVALAACMASHAQRAAVHGERYRGTFLAALFCLLSFVAVSAVSIHLAWELLKGAVLNLDAVPALAVWAAALILAVAKPMTAFVITGVRAIDRYEERLEDQARADEARERSNLVKIDDERLRRSSAAGMAAIGAAAALLGGQAGEAQAAPLLADTAAQSAPESEEQAPAAPLEVAGTTIRAENVARFLAFREMREAGYTAHMIAKMTGYNKSTLYLWDALLAAHREETAAA